MIAALRHATAALILAAVAAGCVSAAEREAAELMARNQELCKADQPQACVRYLDSKCDAALALCAGVRSDQSDQISDLQVRCGAGDQATCQVLESFRCDSGDAAACSSAVARYNRIHAACQSKAQNGCDELTAAAWPNRLIATSEKTCKTGDAVACKVADAAHAPQSGVVVTVPAGLQ